MLRNAIWYYDNYFIQEQRASRYEGLLSTCTENYTLCTEDLREEETTTAELRKQLRVWRGTTITVGATAITTIVLMGVLQ